MIINETKRIFEAIHKIKGIKLSYEIKLKERSKEILSQQNGQ